MTLASSAYRLATESRPLRSCTISPYNLLTYCFSKKYSLEISLSWSISFWRFIRFASSIESSPCNLSRYFCSLLVVLLVSLIIFCSSLIVYWRPSRSWTRRSSAFLEKAASYALRLLFSSFNCLFLAVKFLILLSHSPSSSIDKVIVFFLVSLGFYSAPRSSVDF